MAAQHGNYQQTFAIVKRLAGKSRAHNHSVRLKNGSMATSKQERECRWEEHFAEVFNARIVSFSSLHARGNSSSACLYDHTIPVLPSDTEKSIKKLGQNKGVGIDNIPAELLKAGGSPMAIHVNGVEQRIVDTGLAGRANL